ncbi:hypothetical protein KUTeg_006617 [Tegillarca granosa]|uniref:Anoctamin n=1 Tax=Tegillarca granosa TaxID=220873 RepID=A0ABQ9FAT7_TEGGR|nr:hypothetical protein KUTeg_006617 [Tegillarca granosa]
MKAVSTRVWDTMTGFVRKLWAPFELDKETFPPLKHRFMLTFSREKEYLFDIPEEKELFFDNATRSRIVNFILRRKSFSDKHKEAFTFGVNKMIADGHYVAAYPLHEGHWKAGSSPNSRKRLFDNWSHWRNFFKMQPLNYIRQYYGEKIGLYFVWLGFYTQMLIPASIVGLIVFIYGCAIMNDSYPSKEICDPNTNVTMCPLCDFQCPYWNLVEACTHAKASRIFDNGGTVFFAIFMALWGTLFLEFWKRKQATMQFKWDLTDFVSEEQPPRPEYLAKLEDVNTYKIHPITGLREPHLPFWRRRFPVFLLSWSVMFFMAALAIGAVVGVIAYRVSVLAALQIITRTKPDTNSTFIAATNDVIYENAGMLTTVTAACINLLFIIILNMFVNYYSSIVYIAFFKGRIVGRPGNYSTIFGARNEECEAGGCLIELCIQLAIIMTGKQLILNNITEIIIPGGGGGTYKICTRN